MEAILNHFRTITAIPRCSGDASAMKAYLKAFALEQGFRVHEDEAGNLVCVKGHPKICLQAHYDMVCIGEVSSIDIVQEGKWIRAKNSTLGADNGMGMAIMFWAMQRYNDLECLFSADEEIGLIGASAFRMPLRASYLLNLDSEEEGRICIGCAGGVDIVATLALQTVSIDATMHLYEIEAEGFLGGHSGVDIDKNIPSAIKAVALEIIKHPSVLVSFEGGDRRNAIAKSAKAVVATHEEIVLVNPSLSIRRIERTEECKGLKASKVIMGALAAFAQGVRAWDNTLHIPSVSINIGVVKMQEGFLRIDCAARAMDDENLAILADETEAYFKMLGFETTQESWHGAWKPHAGALAHTVKAIMQPLYPEVSLYAIHAGLECGELIAHQPKKIEALSIGPTIHFPHSLRETCDMESVGRMKNIINTIIHEVTYGTD